MTKVLFVTTGLTTGGAEVMLARLIEQLRRDRFECRVVSLISEGRIGTQMRQAGMHVEYLDIPRGRITWSGFGHLCRIIKGFQPDVVQTWMYHANVIGGLAARFSRFRAPVYWSLHNTAGDFRWATRATILAGAALSHFVPRKVISCSRSGLQAHRRLGYSEQKLAFISNGVDTERFLFSAEGRERVRRELDIPADAMLVGSLGRFDPAKDHGNLIAAARIVAQAHPQAHFVLCGEGISATNPFFKTQLADTELAARFKLLEARSDVPAFLSALDVFCLSSRTEAFPVSLLEAMSCQVPCAVTDVGDCAEIVGELGKVVPPAQPEQLAGTLQEILRLPVSERIRLGEASRQRVERNYRASLMAERFQELYSSDPK
jgi:glycosyltransferase involved in cell wall biosynthesis